MIAVCTSKHYLSITRDCQEESPWCDLPPRPNLRPLRFGSPKRVSKKGTITLNGILGNPVIVKHKYMWLPSSVAISGGESHYSFNGVQPDPRFGSALNSKDDLFWKRVRRCWKLFLFRGHSCCNRAITPTIQSCSNWDFSNPSINRTDTWLNRAVSANRLISQRSLGASALVRSCNVLRNQRVDSNPPENFRNP